MGKRGNPRPALSAKQQRFVDEYLIDLNATQAYVRAGYRAKPDVCGPRLLGNARIADAVARGKAKLAARTEWTQERVIAQLAPIAEADIREAMRWDRDRVTFIPSDELPDHVARSISEVQSETRTFSDDAGNETTTIKLKLKFYDKLTATDQLARHFGFYKPSKFAPTDPTGTKPYEPLTDEERAVRVAEILDRARRRKDE